MAEEAQAQEQAPEAPAEDQPQSFGLWVDESADAPAEEAAPQEQTQETEAEPEPEEPKSEAQERVSRAWAQLDQRERQLLAERQKIKEQHDQISQFMQAKQLLSEGKSAEALKMIGADPTQLLVDYWGNDLVGEQQKPEESQQSDKRYEELQKQIEEMRAKDQQREEQMAIQQQYQSIYGAVAGKEDFPVTNLLLGEGDAQRMKFLEDVRQTIDYEEQTYGTRPELSDVLQRAEEAMFTEYCGAFEKMASLPKFRDKFQELLAGSTKEPAPTKEPTPKSAPTPTLTNRLQAESASDREGDLTDEEREQLALKALKESLWVADE